MKALSPAEFTGFARPISRRSPCPRGGDFASNQKTDKDLPGPYPLGSLSEAFLANMEMSFAREFLCAAFVKSPGGAGWFGIFCFASVCRAKKRPQRALFAERLVCNAFSQARIGTVPTSFYLPTLRLYAANSANNPASAAHVAGSGTRAYLTYKPSPLTAKTAAYFSPSSSVKRFAEKSSAVRLP